MNCTNFTRRGIVGALLGGVVLARPKIAVIAHRGEHMKHRENSLQGIAAAIEMGVDFVELDVRTSRDGRLVLSHDASIGGRLVVEMLLPELKALGVVEFVAALELMAGKCGLYLDWKEAEARQLARAVERAGILERTVVYGRVEKLKQLQTLQPGLRVMPEAVSAAHLEECLRELKPKVVAFDHRDFNEAVIQVAKRAGVDIYVDRLGPPDTREHWLEAVRLGATGIQTDHPAELIAVLSSQHE